MPSLTSVVIVASRIDTLNAVPISRIWPPPASTWNGRCPCATWNHACPRSRRTRRCEPSNASASAVPASSTAVLPSSSCTTRGAVLLRRSLRASSNAWARPRPSAPPPLRWPAATAAGGAVRSDAALGDRWSVRAARPALRARQRPAAARRPAAGARPAHGGDRPAASAAGFVAGVPAADLHCTVSPSATPAWPDAARFGRGHGCGLPHRERVRFPVVTAAGTICPRQSPLIGPFPAAVAGSAALRATHACRPGSWRFPGAPRFRARSGPGSG